MSKQQTWTRKKLYRARLKREEEARLAQQDDKASRRRHHRINSKIASCMKGIKQ